MRIQFDYDVENIEDIQTGVAFAKHIIQQCVCRVTGANVYLSMKDENNNTVTLNDECGNLIKYVIKKKPIKNKEPYAKINCDDYWLYIYKHIDKAKTY